MVTGAPQNARVENEQHSGQDGTATVLSCKAPDQSSRYAEGQSVSAPFSATILGLTVR